MWLQLRQIFKKIHRRKREKIYFPLSARNGKTIGSLSWDTAVKTLFFKEIFIYVLSFN